MSVQGRVEEWLSKMGYDGAIPPGLSKICNPSTAFIWEQFISNVKPRQEVEQKRKTIIVNRLSQKSLEQQGEFSYPIKEIQVYVEKQECEKRVKYLEKEIEEKEEIIDRALARNKVTCVTIDNIKAKIRESKQRKYLLDKKSKVFEEDIQKAGEVLTLARNLTPVEMEASANTDEITQTLQKCAEKLQKLSDSISMPKTRKHSSQSSSLASTTKAPKYFKKTSFSQYVDRSTTLTDIAPSCKKVRDGNKENFNSMQNSTMVSRCLKFSDGGNGVKKNVIAEREPKRESLGLLSVDLNTSEDVDDFLLSPTKRVESVLQPLSDSVFEEQTNFEILEKLRGDKAVKEILKDLLHKNNRYLIVNQCRNIYEQLLREFRTPIMECNKLISLDRNVSKADLTDLYFVHLKSELEKEKCRIILKNLQETVKKRKEEILCRLCSKNRNRDEVVKKFELQIEENYLAGANNFLRKEINASKQSENDNELQVTDAKIRQVKEEIIVKSGCIQSLITSTCKVLEDIKHNREETYLCVRKLNPFIQDETWANVMTQGNHSEEINLFKKFPIEYNRTFKYNNTRISHSAVSDTTIPPYVKLESNDLEVLTRLMDIPFASSENVIFDILRTRISTNMLKSTRREMQPFDDYHKYTPQELRQREDFVEAISDKLRSILNSSEVKEVLGGPNSIKQATALIVEMPFRNFISEKRQVDGHGYKFYENVLNKLKNE